MLETFPQRACVCDVTMPGRTIAAACPQTEEQVVMKSMLPNSWLRYGSNALAGKALWLWRKVVDLIWPPQCPLTGLAVSDPGVVHPDAWVKLTFLDAPRCAICGAPFAYPLQDDMVCGGCIGRRPAYDRARSALVYDEHSRALILALKHAGRTDALPVFGRWMRRAGEVDLKNGGVLIPIPLHARRLRQRRFNQSLLLAHAVSGVTGLDVDPHLLRRLRPTPSQGGLNAVARRRNVAGVFGVRGKACARVRGGRFILIDDVYTTGATLEACAKVLKRADAENVTALTLARVVKPVDPLK